jgi:hypothetical protein
MVESNKKDKTPTEASSKEEVLAFFKWWKEGMYSQVFSKSTNGKDLLGFTEAQLRDFIGLVDGSALYNELHPPGESTRNQRERGSFVKNAIVV